VNGFNVVYQQLYLCSTVVVGSTIAGPDSSRVYRCKETEVPSHR